MKFFNTFDRQFEVLVTKFEKLKELK